MFMSRRERRKVINVEAIAIAHKGANEFNIRFENYSQAVDISIAKMLQTLDIDRIQNVDFFMSIF